MKRLLFTGVFALALILIMLKIRPQLFSLQYSGLPLTEGSSRLFDFGRTTTSPRDVQPHWSDSSLKVEGYSAGQMIWTFKPESSNKLTPCFQSLVSNNSVIFLTCSYRLYSLNLDDGKVIWIREFSDKLASLGEKEGQISVKTQAGNTFALASDGQIK